MFLGRLYTTTLLEIVWRLYNLCDQLCSCKKTRHVLHFVHSKHQVTDHRVLANANPFPPQGEDEVDLHYQSPYDASYINVFGKTLHYNKLKLK